MLYMLLFSVTLEEIRNASNSSEAQTLADSLMQEDPEKKSKVVEIMKQLALQARDSDKIGYFEWITNNDPDSVSALIPEVKQAFSEAYGAYWDFRCLNWLVRYAPESIQDLIPEVIARFRQESNRPYAREYLDWIVRHDREKLPDLIPEIVQHWVRARSPEDLRAWRLWVEKHTSEWQETIVSELLRNFDQIDRSYCAVECATYIAEHAPEHIQQLAPRILQLLRQEDNYDYGRNLADWLATYAKSMIPEAVTEMLRYLEHNRLYGSRPVEWIAKHAPDRIPEAVDRLLRHLDQFWTPEILTLADWIMLQAPDRFPDVVRKILAHFRHADSSRSLENLANWLYERRERLTPRQQMELFGNVSPEAFVRIHMSHPQLATFIREQNTLRIRQRTSEAEGFEETSTAKERMNPDVNSTIREFLGALPRAEQPQSQQQLSEQREKALHEQDAQGGSEILQGEGQIQGEETSPQRQ